MYSCRNNNNDDGNNNGDNDNNNNNNNNRAYPSRHSGQPALALIGWFERAVTLCGGTKSEKQQSHRSSFKFRLLDWRILIDRLCGTDPYSFMKEHVISIEKVSC